jgi:hypothetical protein
LFLRVFALGWCRGDITINFHNVLEPINGGGGGGGGGRVARLGFRAARASRPHSESICDAWPINTAAKAVVSAFVFFLTCFLINILITFSIRSSINKTFFFFFFFPPFFLPSPLF